VTLADCTPWIRALLFIKSQNIMATLEQREELHRTIWAMADELRGAVGGWEFKAYVLGVAITKVLPPMPIFGNAAANREMKKRTVLEKLTLFFNKYFSV
jgi:type I restriction-modification system DNA methylase subunit